MKTTTIKGTLKHNSLEGGFWEIATNAGQTYNLGRISEPMVAHAGDTVEVTGELDEQVASIFMRGRTFKVQSIRAVEDHGV